MSLFLISQGILQPATGGSPPSVVYSQNFNTLNDGNLRNQDGWSHRDGNSHLFQVQSSIVFEGAKAVSVVTDSAQLRRNWDSAVTAGSFYFALRSADVTKGAFSLDFIRPDGSDIGGIRLDPTLGISFFNNDVGSRASLVASPVSNQWYVVECQWDRPVQGTKMRYRIHDGTSWSAYTSWHFTYQDTWESVAGLLLIVWDPGTGPGTVYFDKFSGVNPVL